MWGAGSWGLNWLAWERAQADLLCVCACGAFPQRCALNRESPFRPTWLHICKDQWAGAGAVCAGGGWLLVFSTSLSAVYLCRLSLLAGKQLEPHGLLRLPSDALVAEAALCLPPCTRVRAWVCISPDPALEPGTISLSDYGMGTCHFSFLAFRVVPLPPPACSLSIEGKNCMSSCLWVFFSHATPSPLSAVRLKSVTKSADTLWASHSCPLY